MNTKKPSAKNVRNRGAGAAVYMPSALQPVCVALLAGIITFSAILMFFALIMSFKDVPIVLLGPMSVASLVIGCLVSGFVIGRLTRSSGLPYGALCGFIIYALIFIMSFLIGESVGLAALLKLAISMLSGSIGGVVGVNMRVKHKK